MRFPDLKLTVACLASSLIIVQGCSQNLILSEQDRTHLGRIGIVRAQYAPELGLDTYAVGGSSGAAKGALGGLGVCLQATAKAGGQSNALLAVLFMPIICPPLMAYGGYYGAQKAMTKEAASTAENLTTKQADTIQEMFLQSVLKNIEDDGYVVKVIEKAGPSSSGDTPDYKYLKKVGIDTVFEVALEKVIFKGEGSDPELTLHTSAGCRLVRTKDNGEIHKYLNVSTARGGYHKAAKWADNDAQMLRDELSSSLDFLADQIISSALIRSTTVICPGPPFDKQIEDRDFGNEQRVIVDSFQPTFAWSPPRKLQWDESKLPISEIEYQLRVWKANGETKTLVYERKGLKQPNHRLEELLEPSTLYAWSVRARFKYDGQERLSKWSCRATDSINYYDFQTPSYEKSH